MVLHAVLTFHAYMSSVFKNRYLVVEEQLENLPVWRVTLYYWFPLFVLSPSLPLALVAYLGP